MIGTPSISSGFRTNSRGKTRSLTRRPRCSPPWRRTSGPTRLYASDVVISRDARFGQDDWHQRAVDAYYLQSGPLLATMRAEISTLSQLAPRANYDAFLQLYEEEISALDSCLLELMKLEAASSGDPQPSGCVASEGKFAGASWDTLAAVSWIRTWPTASIGSLRTWPRRSVSRERLTSVPEC